MQEAKKVPVPFFIRKVGLINQAPKYEKPLFEKTEGMNFTAEIWEKLNGGPGCMQCSSCHGCA